MTTSSKLGLNFKRQKDLKIEQISGHKKHLIENKRPINQRKTPIVFKKDVLPKNLNIL